MPDILMHKNAPVLEFELHPGTGAIARIGRVFCLEHIRLSGGGAVRKEPGRLELNEWWMGRCVPGTRIGIT